MAGAWQWPATLGNASSIKPNLLRHLFLRFLVHSSLNFQPICFYDISPCSTWCKLPCMYASLRKASWFVCAREKSLHAKCIVVFYARRPTDIFGDQARCISLLFLYGQRNYIAKYKLSFHFKNSKIEQVWKDVELKNLDFWVLLQHALKKSALILSPSKHLMWQKCS